jgi:hypothetical protein
MDKKIIYLDTSNPHAVLPSSVNWSRVAGADRVGMIESLAVLWLGGWALFATVMCISQTMALSI